MDRVNDQLPEDVAEIELENIPSEEDDSYSSPPQYEITTYPADYTLSGLHDLWRQSAIMIPRFQRQFVWTQVQASKLIESFLVGLPVPAIFLYTERKSQKFLVIDGQQRLKSIFYFFEGYFAEDDEEKRKLFRLKGLSERSPWFNKSFDEFSEEDQLRLRNSVLRAFIVKQLNPEDDTSIYHVFERLNTGGTLLTNQEVRNCVYGGTFNDLLSELNELDSWRKILGKPRRDRRQRDLELILRFFALQDITGYEKPLKDYLSKFMQRHRHPSKEIIESYRRRFTETCKSVVSFLGEKPFHIRAGLNSAAYDSVMVWFSRHPHDVREGILDRYRSLIGDEAFSKLTATNTTDVEVVRKRFEMAGSVLFSG